MANSKDTASFFENGTSHQFEFCYKIYPQVLKLRAEKKNKKPQELIRLDEWYQNELPKLIKARGKDAHMVYDELVQTMKWKQTRGKFYPQLSYLVKVNTPRAVMTETKKAFRKLPNLEQAITALSNLKGVGTTMASALLAAAAPDKAPFMADECLMSIPEFENIDYTTKEYLNFVQHVQATVERLNTELGGETPFWSPHRVELALWAHYVANDLSPELLDEMPGPGAGGGANTNGSTVKSTANAKELGGQGEDTNDGDEESLSTADNEHINAATATSVPAALQDGDSNFVSNDSTSQEPIIDENTTQTTATTSTDDGEVGTPLASDSESNLEAPEKAKLNKISNSNSSINANANTNSNSDIVGIGHSVSDNSNNSRQKDTIVTPVGNSNGNGTLVSLGAIVSDGENSSCLRSTGNDEVSEEDDVNGEDDSSNSNTAHIGQSHKPITSLLGGNLNDTANYNAAIANDSTLSSAAGGIVAQKRVLHCNEGGSSEFDGNLAADEANSQPELKKIRSE